MAALTANMISAVGWRAVFQYFAIAGAIVSVITLITVKEPKRKDQNEEKAIKDDDKEIDENDEVISQKSIQPEKEEKKTFR